MTTPRAATALSYACALLWGLQFAFLTPALALLLSKQMHASDAEIGLALALYNGSGFVASLVIPAWADRTQRFLSWMLLCGVATFALAATLAVTSSLWVSLAALALLAGPAGVGLSLFFAFVRASGAGPAAVMNTRAMVSAGWVAGPPLAMLLAGWAGIRAVPLAVMGFAVASVVVISRLRKRTTTPGAPEADVPEAALPLSRARVVAVVAAFVVIQAANATATASMTLFAVGTLGLTPGWGGAALGLAALAEIPMLWWLGRLSRRHSARALLVLGCAAGVGYFVLLSLVTGPVMLLGIQLLNAWFYATVAGVGLTLFQDMLRGPGLASGLYMNAHRVGAVLSGGVVALAGTTLGFAGAYLVCAGLVAAGLAIIVVAARPARGATPRA